MNLELLKQYNAKSKEEGISIFEHNEMIISLLNQLELSEKEYIIMVRIANYHDIGKVVDNFQDNIEGRSRDIRHEILSASAEDLTDIERIAILTHHKSWQELSESFLFLKYDSKIRSLYKQQLKELENKLKIGTIDIVQDFFRLKSLKELLKSPQAIRLKGYLNLCDHLASAGVTKIDKGFDVDRFVFKHLNTIQHKAKRHKKDTIIIASTGSGKTITALYWAISLNPERTRRIYYILPYTTSINALYKRFKEKDISVGMLHSKAEYFLYEELAEKDQNIDYRMLGIYSKRKYQTFKYFTKHITIATIYQIFKAIFNCKFNEMMFAMYSNSFFIIDEIHCYDEKQLAIILVTLKFLKDKYNINICIMSASIPTNLLNLIKSELEIKSVLRLTNEENDRNKKHRIHCMNKDIKSSVPKVIESYNRGQKVIVCCNEIDKSIDMYKRIIGIKNVDIEDVVLIHSRFIFKDRERIENSIMHIEKEKQNKKILIGTSAIEVSLDIDYDEMHTELAPMDRQVQRWGRINRKHWSNLTDIKDIYVYNYDGMVYPENLLRKTSVILRKIDIVDENKIQDYLDFVYEDEFEKYDEYKRKMQNISESCMLGEWDSSYNRSQVFDSINVLPSCFVDIYNDLVLEKDYYEANSYFVSITKRKYNEISSKGAMKIPVKQGSLPSDYVSVVHCRYDRNMGLLLDEFL